MFRYALLAFLAFLITTPSIYGQRPGNKIRDRINRQRDNARDNDEDDKLKTPEVEGVIWEYKLIDRRTDETKSSGKLRIRQSAVYSVDEVKVGDDSRQEIKDALARRLNREEDEKIGGERIGDLTAERNRRSYTFTFDEDDNHELSGKVTVTRDDDNSGVWFGTYRHADGSRLRIEFRELKDSSNGPDNERNDVSGVVWEFKVINRRSDATELDGKFRLDETGIFDVAKAKTDEGVRNALRRRIENEEAERTGGERIGDFTFVRRSKEYTLVFDADDNHPLSGRAVLNPDRNVSGLWYGTYVDEQKSRWRFEMRKVED